MNEGKTAKSGSEGMIRVFRALVVLAVGIALAYFLSVTETNPNTRYPFKLGLDLAGGTHLVYEADVKNIAPEEVPDLMNILREVIERRVNVFGVSEPIVQVEKSSVFAEDSGERLIVELPGVTDIEEAVRQIGKTPLLEFKLLNEEALTTATGTGTGTPAYLDTGLTGRYFERAEAMLPQSSQGPGFSTSPYLNITFNEEGARLFEEITRENVGKQLAIFLDGKILSEPRINEPIAGGRAVITGTFTREEVHTLAQNLNFGALPVPITLVSTQSIGATLGERAVDAGVYSGVLGLAAITLFMTLWYRLPGFVAGLSLLMYVMLMLAVFKLIPVTLTAAGLAGMVLSLGLAVDANILISERLKEELRRGAKPVHAIEEGFRQAWTSIRDGNLVNILSGFILYWFGDVFIEGFAFTLIIGTIISLLSSLVVSRTFLMALAREESGPVSRFLMGSGIHL